VRGLGEAGAGAGAGKAAAPAAVAGRPETAWDPARPSVLQVQTLTDGSQPAARVAEWLAAFIGEARRSLAIALYDFALSETTAASVIGALNDAARRGVQVRLLYNEDHDQPIPVPPPPQTNRSLLEACGVPTRGVPGIPDLMHHKYVVRDGEAVWTGSMNWTEDSWTREENVIAVVPSHVIASTYARNFEELWSTRRVAGSGEYTPDPVDVAGVPVRVLFSPGRGRRLAHRIASALGHAQRRIQVCSPVMTSGAVIATLAEVAAAGRVDVAGVLDATQMAEVRRQWQEDAAWKIPIVESILAKAPFSGKRSTPYGPGTVHDYMHAKVVVADDTVFLGSYNLSHSGEENAENVLEISSADLAERLAGFIDGLRARYEPMPDFGR
jgi:phosphatidylserine/phosphatidylglycerophosphate/cardiolipin synthase-like enzyme